MAGKKVNNISPDKQTEIIVTLAKVDERTEYMLKMMEKNEASVQTQINELVGKVEAVTIRTTALETDKKRIMSIVAAGMLLISCLAWLGGDYVKSAVFGPPAIAHTTELNQKD